MGLLEFNTTKTILNIQLIYERDQIQKEQYTYDNYS